MVSANRDKNAFRRRVGISELVIPTKGASVKELAAGIPGYVGQLSSTLLFSSLTSCTSTGVRVAKAG